MSKPPRPPVPPFFSTDMFAERERVTAWREMIRSLAHLDVVPLPDTPFHARAKIRLLSDTAIVSGAGSLGSSGRTRDLVADGNDSMILQVTSTDGVASQQGRDIPVPAGDGVILSNAEVGNFTFGSEQSSLGILLPRDALQPLLIDPDIIGRTIPKDSEALRLLKAYAAAIEREPEIANAELQRSVAAHLQDLVALALGATADAEATAQSRGLPAARLHEAKTYVLRHLGQSSLSAAHVAAHLGVTPRYVHMLFAAEPMSFSQFVLAERLARAHRMLNEPRYAAETISAIAYAVGFADLSHFNRSFRQRYGGTPSDVRAARMREGGES